MKQPVIRPHALGSSEIRSNGLWNSIQLPAQHQALLIEMVYLTTLFSRKCPSDAKAPIRQVDGDLAQLEAEGSVDACGRVRQPRK